MDQAKIEAGKFTLEKSPFDLHELLEEIERELQPQTMAKKLSFTLDASNIEHNKVIGDSLRIKQIIVNLLSNSIKFTEVGSVSLLVTSRDKQPDSSCANTAGSNDSFTVVSFQLKDTGIGIEADVIPKLFNDFEQADVSTTKKYGGTGLGLAIVNALVEMMKGKIEVESSPGEGSTFTVTLPLAIDEKQTTENVDNKRLEIPNFTDRSILLAEDNLVNQKIFVAMMSKTNANIEIAENGKEALEKVSNHKPELIFMDIQMPEMDGINACQLLKKMCPDIPIIALTANVLQEDIELYQQIGFDGHIGKPIELPELLTQSLRFLRD